MADKDTDRLKKILTETYRNAAKDKQVKAAIRKRIADKKKVKKHGKGAVDKVTAHNLKHSTLSEEAKAAQKRKQTAAGSDKVGKKKVVPKKKPKVKKDVFSVGLAISRVRNQKDKNKQP